jgi:hypothetical protein
VSARKLRVWVAATGILSIASATALATHAVLWLAQSGMLLGGDYARHAHCSVLPIASAAVTTGALALCLYAVHLIGEDVNSLPALARQFQKLIGWRTIALIALSACLILVGMETAEQFAVGHFDGFSSALGGLPAVGLGIVVLFAAAGNVVLSALCRWLAGAHTRIVVALAFLLGFRDSASALSSRRCKRLAAIAVCYVRDFSQVHGTRAPPSIAS